MSWSLIARLRAGSGSDSGGDDGDGQAAIDAGRAAIEKIYAAHGQASGVISGQECMAGRSPESGTETCMVVETMDTLAWNVAITGDMWYADLLERVALNAMPAAFFNGSMWSLTYFQQANKPSDGTGARSFTIPYECCTSNHPMGWPRYAARQFMVKNVADHESESGSDGALLMLWYHSSEATGIRLTATNSVNMSTTGSFPFGADTGTDTDTAADNTAMARLAIRADAPFTLLLRIPGWAMNVSSRARGAVVASPVRINGVPVPAASVQEGVLRYPLTTTTATAIDTATGPTLHWSLSISFPMAIRIEDRYDGRVAVYRGPLLYSLPVPYTAKATRMCTPRGSVPAGNGSHGCTWKLQPTLDAANATLVIANRSHPELGGDLTYRRRHMRRLPPGGGQGPFATALVNDSIVATVFNVSDCWKSPTDACSRANHKPSCQDTNSSGAGRSRQVLLLPFGSTDLRMTEMRLVSQHHNNGSDPSAGNTSDFISSATADPVTGRSVVPTTADADFGEFVGQSVRVNRNPWVNLRSGNPGERTAICMSYPLLDRTSHTVSRLSFRYRYSTGYVPAHSASANFSLVLLGACASPLSSPTRTVLYSSPPLSDYVYNSNHTNYSAPVLVDVPGLSLNVSEPMKLCLAFANSGRNVQLLLEPSAATGRADGYEGLGMGVWWNNETTNNDPLTQTATNTSPPAERSQPHHPSSHSEQESPSRALKRGHKPPEPAEQHTASTP
jgi:hypothetical protein